MKKIFYFSLFVASALTFSSCTHEEDDVFDKSAAEILNEVSGLYSERLSSSKGGWAIEYYPKVISDFDPNSDNIYQVQGYLLLANFMKDGSVETGMKNVLSNNAFISDRSSWDIITDLGPVLSFSTYNKCVHPFAEPEPNGSLDTDKGKGLEGDYEFVMLDVPENPEYIMLKGKKRGVYIRMSTLDEGTDFATYYKDLETLNKRFFNQLTPNNLVMTLGENVINVKGANTGFITTWPVDGDEVADASYRPFLTLIHNGQFRLRFRDAIELSDGTKVQEFEYNEEDDLFRNVENPDFTLSGPRPSQFFYDWMKADNSWRYTPSTQASNSLKNTFNDLSKELKSSNASLNNIQFSISDNTLNVMFNLKRGSDMIHYSYIFDMKIDGENVQLNYKNASDDDSIRGLNSFPTLKSILDKLSSTFIVKSNDTGMALLSLRLTSTANADDWIVLNNFKK